MAKPIILTVDDEPQVLAAIQRDLRTRFGRDYRIVAAGGGPEALDLARDLAGRGAQVALLLSDQRMPGLEGTALLAAAAKHHPHAKKALLTAYADTQAAIDSINEIGLDYYLMKPWDPPEEQLYPVLDDLLADWQAEHPAPFDGIRVAGTLWSPGSHEVKDFLSRNHVPFRWLDVDTDDAARELVEGAQEAGRHRLPVVFFPDGTVLVDPGVQALAETVGLHTAADKPHYDLAILGGGPAGLAAAVYGASEGLSTVMIERRAPGGQAGTSSFIENYLGFPKGLSGADLARRALTQAKRFGVEILTADARRVTVDGPVKRIELADAELTCKALVLATGVRTRTLDRPGIESLTGRGVFYGASLAEAALYAGHPMLVVGAANSAGQAALYFSRYASDVTIVARGASLEKGMSHYLVEQLAARPNVRTLVRTEVDEVHGDGRLEAVTLVNRDTHEVHRLDARAMFVFIGAEPCTELVSGLVTVDESGYVRTGPALGARPRGWNLDRDPMLLETSLPGVFAAGDVRSGSTKRVATAVGEGANAVALVHAYLRNG